jgi:hypothetical protein
VNWKQITKEFADACVRLEAQGAAVVLELDAYHATMLVALLQFAISSGRLPEDSEKAGRVMANSIIDALGEADPTVKRCMMLGWNNDLRTR